jgi:hypothetical protein
VRGDGERETMGNDLLLFALIVVLLLAGAVLGWLLLS